MAAESGVLRTLWLGQAPPIPLQCGFSSDGGRNRASAAAPIRLKNLTGLNLTDNLIARAKSFYLVIGEHETKNREPIDFELPAETVKFCPGMCVSIDPSC